MKKLSLLFVAIIATFCFTIVSCKDNTANTITPTAATDAPDPSEDDEVFDNEDEKEVFDLEDRAAKIKITELVPVPTAIWSTPNLGSDYYAKQTGKARIFTGSLLNVNALGRNWKIRGYGFGASQENSVVSAIASKDFSLSLSVTSWTDTLIEVKITNNAPAEYKTFNTKFTILRGDGKKVSKTFKCFASLEFTAAASQPVGYPQWEILYQRMLLNMTYVGNPTWTVIDSTYAPRVGDIVKRSIYDSDNTAYRFHNRAIIVSIDSLAKKPKYRIFERNFNGKGTLTRKYYYYDTKTGFTVKTGDVKFDKYAR